MRIINGHIFDLEKGFVERDLYTDGKFISETSDDSIVVDAKDCYVIPGLVDVHFHGAVGEDFSDATPEGLQKIADFELSQGVTYICPAGMTLGEDQLTKICENAAAHRAKDTTGAEVVGTEAFAGDTAAKKQTLAEALAGTSLTVTYNGVSKQITFNETDKDKYATVDDLAAYMQSSLDKSYGVGKVNLTSSDGKISFASSDSSSIFAVNNSTGQNIIGDGDTLFGMKAGESNRTELLKTLDEIADSLATPLQKDANGKYSMSINGVDFSFDGDTLFGDMIGQINRSDANVNISYSSVISPFSTSYTIDYCGNSFGRFC